MKQLIKNMVTRMTGILLLILTVAPAMAQIPVTHIEIDQCDAYIFSVVEWPGDRYTWDLYTAMDWDTVNFATHDGNVDKVTYFEDGNNLGSTVMIDFLESGRYILKIEVWDEVTCTNNLRLFSVNVVEHVPEATIIDSMACYGEPAEFRVIITGKGPWDAIYTYGDGTANLNLKGEDNMGQIATLPALPPDTYEVWVKQIVDQCSSNLEASPKGRVVIYPKPTIHKGIHPVER